MKLRKKGHDYVAKVEMEFDCVERAEQFAFLNTEIGKAVTTDLEDTVIQTEFARGEAMVVEVMFHDDLVEGVTAELEAAEKVGADITVELTWVKDEG